MVHQELKKGIATMVSQAWQQHERDRRLVSRSAKEVLEVMQTQWEQDIEKGLNETFMTAIRFGDKDLHQHSESHEGGLQKRTCRWYSNEFGDRMEFPEGGGSQAGISEGEGGETLLPCLGLSLRPMEPLDEPKSSTGLASTAC